MIVSGAMLEQEGDEYGEDTSAVVQTALEARYLTNPLMGAMHDSSACSALNPFASNVVKVLLPALLELIGECCSRSSFSIPFHAQDGCCTQTQSLVQFQNIGMPKLR